MSFRHGPAALLAVFAMCAALPSAATAREGVLAFAAPVESAFLRVVVTDGTGRTVSGPPEFRDEDASLVAVPIAGSSTGPYRISWRAMSRDGDVVRGGAAVAATAALGEGVRAEPDIRPLVIAERLLRLMSPVILLGLAVARFWVVGKGGGDTVDHAGWWRAWWCATGAGLLGLLLAPIAQLRALGAGAGDITSLLGDTRWGASWIIQGAALALAGASAATLGRGSSTPFRAASVIAGPALALGAIAWSGHASTGGDRAIGIGADVLHGWATATWLGGLVGVFVLVVPALRGLGDEARTRLAAPIVVRFSTLAVSAVAVLVVTGVYRALAELSSLSDLVDTAYGRALAVKLGVFALMLGVGAYNRFVIHPRLERAALGLDPTDRGAALALRRSVGAELMLAAVVIVTVSVLVTLPPPT